MDLRLVDRPTMRPRAGNTTSQPSLLLTSATRPLDRRKILSAEIHSAQDLPYMSGTRSPSNSRETFLQRARMRPLPATVILPNFAH